jgi:hypothetical protein
MRWPVARNRGGMPTGSTASVQAAGAEVRLLPITDASRGRQDDHEQRPAANGHMQAVGTHRSACRPVWPRPVARGSLSARG